MSDGNKLLADVNCQYGAPMGRPTITDNPEAKVRLFRVEFFSGDYDRGGAYWGGGSPLYAAIGDGFQAFCRADNRQKAKEKLLNDFPKLRFYR